MTTAEEYVKKNGKDATLVHLGKPKEQWFESWKFYPKNGYVEIEDCVMRKEVRFIIILTIDRYQLQHKEKIWHKD